MEEWLKHPNKKARLFARESKKAEGKVSHAVQEEKALEYAKQFGLDLTATSKISESAKRSSDRRKYQEAIDQALKDGVRHLLFYMSDREARNLTDVEKNEILVIEDKVVLHYIAQHKVLHRRSSPADFFFRDIDAVMNKQSLRLHTLRMVDVMTQKAEQGWCPVNHLPLGYAHIKNRTSDGREAKRGTTIGRDPDSSRVRLVQREFELRAKENLSAENIAKRIKVEGLVPPSLVRSYSWKGVAKRLRHPFYWGKFIWQGREYKGKHELIIDRRILSAVEVSFQGSNRGRRINIKQGAFSDVLRCANPECQRAITYEPKIKKIKSTGELKEYPYYRCSNSRKVHNSLTYVPESQIWTHMSSAVDSISITEPFAQRIADFLNEAQIRAKAAHQADAQSYKKDLQRIEEKEDQLYQQLSAQVIDETTYKRQLDRLRQERSHYTELSCKAQEAISDVVMVTVKKVLELAMSAKSLWNMGTPEEKVEYLKMVCSNQLLDGASVRYELKKPFATLAEMKIKEEWRPQGDSNPCIHRERVVSWASRRWGQD